MRILRCIARFSQPRQATTAATPATPATTTSPDDSCATPARGRGGDSPEAALPTGKPPPEVLAFQFSSFSSVENVKFDYLDKSPCLRDIEAQYGPGVRKKKGLDAHWRSKEHQGDEKKAKSLCKAFSKRKPIFELFDHAEGGEVDADAVVTRLNEQILENFEDLDSADAITNVHMEWLSARLSAGREARGMTFEKRQSMGQHAAQSRKAARLANE